jgi:hypothetical protein
VFSLPSLSRGVEGAAPQAPALSLAGLFDLALEEGITGRAVARRAEAAELPTLAEQRAHRRLRRGLAGDLRSAVRGAA